MSTIAAPATSRSFKSALRALKAGTSGEEGRAAADFVVETVRSSIWDVVARWDRRGTLARWHDRDDLYQELTIALLTRGVRGFVIQDGASDAEVARQFGGYALVVLNNALLDMLKHTRRVRSRAMHAVSMDASCSSGNDEGLSLANTLEDTRDYENAPGGMSEREMLGAIRGRLTDEQAQVAYLLYEGKSWPEIAAIMGESKSTLRERLHSRAGPAIRAILDRWMS